MFEIKKILHPTDFSDHAKVAFDHAFHLARHYEAELHVLHVVPSFGDDPILGAYDAAVDKESFLVKLLGQKADGEMRSYIAPYQKRHPSIQQVVSRGSAAAPVIIDYAAKNQVDVIVMGTHGRRGIRKAVLGSIAAEVVREAPCSVLTIRKQQGPDDEARPVQRILVPTDFSPHAEQALQMAKDMAVSYGAELHLLHSIRPLPFASTFTSQLSLYELVPELQDKIKGKLEEQLQKTTGPAVPTEFHIAESHPAQAIVAVAKAQQADLIVMGPRGTSGLEHIVLGSVAERVVRTASCPVFVARPTLPPILESTEDTSRVHEPLETE